MEARHLSGIGDIAAEDWDALVGTGNPFVRHEFLRAMEASGSATTKTGWQPVHLVLEADGKAVAAAPLYAKSHSYGEYVFDHGWADGFQRAGGRYYPKLQAAVPFTPVPGPRLLGEPGRRAALAEALVEATNELGVSSLHVTFCTEEEARILAAAGCLVRRGVQYHWDNRGYGCFDDFLDTLRSAKRKMIRRERREVVDAGIVIEVLHGPTMSPAALAEFYPFYTATVDKRWGSAYLKPAFFRILAERMADRVVLVTARQEGRLVAAALNLLGSDTLYGRLWGCLEEFRFLHFEACYYSAIEFAIARGIARVEAGAQGTHKLQRGYAPVWTWSAHHIPHPGFRDAVDRFLRSETKALEEQMGELAAMLPYREP
ncbi:MAG: GNAT family N-acetyltransferase [Geminicoccaceae bacterium]